MDIFYVVALLIAIIIFFIFPIIVIYFLNKSLKRKNKRFTIISIILLVAYSLFVYRDFYPSDLYYKNNFEANTQLRFPNSGKIVDKAASASMFEFGGKDLCAKIDVSAYDYKKMQDQIMHSHFTSATSYLETPDVDNIVNELEADKIEKIYKLEKSGMAYYIMFLGDHKSILYSYSNW